MDRIVIINRSSALTDDQVVSVIPAVQAQVTEDFAPMWGVSAKVVFLGTKDGGGDDDRPLYVYDHTDTPGAGGYHVDECGRVSGKIFAADAIAGGEAWTIDLTHELLEMLVDPSAGTDPAAMVPLPDGKRCLPEVCDAVEADDCAYRKHGVMVTDFVLPQYFFRAAVRSPGGPDPGAYDFKGHLTSGPAPALLYGGYLGIFDPATGMWSQVSMFRRDGTLSRRARRHGRTSWRAGSR